MLTDINLKKENDKMAKKCSTGQWGIRRIGKRAGTVGCLNKYEAKAKPYEFGYGRVWAISLKDAKIKLKKEIKKRYPKGL